ncbi:hypothetical protein AXF42_Ash011854 [Apostasia shenzhenica]|uniref:Uncharacterized protein n=1 Tax=Apostasia shenzhenica TaxID=1088818 RepID=A0A2I0AW12_9ASPA|nr:hypothetical protein AXF42_Ash011854 [Apostasia shenzhenica]
MMTTLTHALRWCDASLCRPNGNVESMAAVRGSVRALGSSRLPCRHAGMPAGSTIKVLSSLLRRWRLTAFHYPLSADDPRRRLMLLSPRHPNALERLSQRMAIGGAVQLDREGGRQRRRGCGHEGREGEELAEEEDRTSRPATEE